MRRRDNTLITQIERDAVDDRVLLSATLRKCLILAGQVGSAELREWVSRELNGYQPEEELPSWRKVPAPLQIDGIQGRFHVRGQTISRYFLPEFARDDITEEVIVFWGVGGDDPQRPRERDPAGPAHGLRIGGVHERQEHCSVPAH